MTLMLCILMCCCYANATEFKTLIEYAIPDNTLLLPHNLHPLDESTGLAEANYTPTTPDPKINLVMGVESRILWDDGVIPYNISSHYGRYARRQIARSITDIHRNTCLRFIQRTDEVDFVEIKPKLGCSSQVGRKGGPQVVSLSAGCMQKTTIIHQLLHLVGLYHENTRFDRDDHIRIHWENIVESPGIRKQFQKFNQSVFDSLPYDQFSLMHYGNSAFAKTRGLVTITALNGQALGNYQGMTAGDIAKVNMLYGCRVIRN